jgi:hypothetical protein
VVSVRQNILVVKTQMDNLFNGVLVHRYRDVSPVIRCDAISLYGRWVLEYQDMFLVNRWGCCR